MGSVVGARRRQVRVGILMPDTAATHALKLGRRNGIVIIRIAKCLHTTWQASGGEQRGSVAAASVAKTTRTRADVWCWMGGWGEEDGGGGGGGARTCVCVVGRGEWETCDAIAAHGTLFVTIRRSSSDMLTGCSTGRVFDFVRLAATFGKDSPRNVQTIGGTSWHEFDETDRALRRIVAALSAPALFAPRRARLLDRAF